MSAQAAIGPGRATLAGCALLALALAPWSAAAQTESTNGGTLRVVLLVGTDLDRALAERVRGQTSDLALQLTVVEGPNESSDLAAVARSADALARAHDAAVALWFTAVERDPAELLIFVAAVGRDPVLVRRLTAQRAGAPLASGLLESAALVVRSSLHSLSGGGALGVTLGVAPDTAAAGARVQATADTATSLPEQDQAPEPSAAELASETSVLDTRYAVLAGWQVAADGLGAPGQHGLTARFAARLALFELGGSISASYPVTIRDALSELTIARHSALVLVGLHARMDQLRVSGGAHAGAIVFQRSTEQRSERLDAAASRFVPEFAFGPWFELAFQPGSFGLGLQLGLDVLPAAPRFVYEEAQAERLIRSPWNFQPRGSLGLVGEL